MGSDVKMKVDEGEEGEIPEADAIVEISKEEFKPSSKQQHHHQQQQQSSTSKTKSATSKASNEIYWKDLYKNYSYPRRYGASNLYNLAWAQAVQNKPLNDVLVKVSDDSNNKNNKNNNSSSGSRVNDDSAANEQDESLQQQQSVNNASNEVVNKKDDSDKEEGELEEGELEEDSDDAENNNNNGNKVEDQFTGMEMEDIELENQVSSIRKVLHNVTVAEAHK